MNNKKILRIPIGDGITDNSDIFQDWIDADKTPPLEPNKTYLLNKILTNHKNITIPENVTIIINYPIVSTQIFKPKENQKPTLDWWGTKEN